MGKRFVGTVSRPALRGPFNLGPVITHEVVEPRTIEVVARDMEDALCRVDWYYPQSEGWKVKLSEK